MHFQLQAQPGSPSQTFSPKMKRGQSGQSRLAFPPFRGFDRRRQNCRCMKVVWTDGQIAFLESCSNVGNTSTFREASNNVDNNDEENEGLGRVRDLRGKL